LHKKSLPSKIFVTNKISIVTKNVKADKMAKKFSFARDGSQFWRVLKKVSAESF